MWTGNLGKVVPRAFGAVATADEVEVFQRAGFHGIDDFTGEPQYDAVDEFL